MKKKLLSLLLTTSIVLSGCGGVAEQTDSIEKNEITTETHTESIKPVEESEEAETTEPIDKINSIGDITVEEGLFDVEITIPESIVGGESQEQLNEKIEDGIKSITLNDDGSATYVMTKAKQKELLEDYKKGLSDYINECVGSEDYPNLVSVEANENLDEYTIITKSESPDMYESMLKMSFSMYSGLYGIFSGNEMDNVKIVYINADTKEVIETYNSSDSE